ncbi:MAG: ATP-binding cassette domain-containing protein [Kitasatospora sp.]|jgi:ABC-2 type transport system ATP-binding protein|nr:ATP-binding cassette domain-containing protein [Kitasatospora sp.]
MIEAIALTKCYGPRRAVDDLSFTVRPGRVTGFLGPNGAGKSTTLRMLLGLVRPTSGRALVDGSEFASRPRGLRQAGALLDAQDVHGGRSGRAHLAALARGNRIPAARVGEVLELVGLGPAADRRIGGYSLGMKQRLGIAGALLGDPPVLLFDEPLNGLDPQGVRWLRGLLRQWAAEGRTVFFSSHMMAEMAHTADHLVVLGRGRLLADEPLAAFAARGAAVRVEVASPGLERLLPLLTAEGADLRPDGPDRCTVSGLPAARIGELALRAGLVLHRLAELPSALEQVFVELTDDHAEHRTLPEGESA